MEVKQKVKALRGNMNPTGLIVLAYYGIMNVGVTVVMLLDLIVYLLCNIHTWTLETLTEYIMQFATSNGWGYLLAIAAGALIVFLWRGFLFWKNEVFAREKKMTPGIFFQLLCVFMSVQTLLMLTTPVIEWLLNQVGLSVMAAMEAASVSSTGLTMFLYVAFIGPVAEELLFRGLLLRILKPYGKRFAILASAILFGLLHGNVIQIPFAAAVGLVLGYVTLEYSIVWAIVLHIFNNFILSDLMGRLTTVLPDGAGDMLVFAILLIVGIIALALIIIHWSDIKVYRKNDPMNKLAVKAFFTSPTVIIFAVLMLLSSLLTITRM